MTRDNGADTIRAARAEVGENAAVSASIYPGDAMRLRQDSGTLTASQYVEPGTDEALSNHTGEVIFRIPKQLARREADIDRLISEMVAPLTKARTLS